MDKIGSELERGSPRCCETMETRRARAAALMWVSHLEWNVREGLLARVGLLLLLPVQELVVQELEVSLLDFFDDVVLHFLSEIAIRPTKNHDVLPEDAYDNLRHRFCSSCMCVDVCVNAYAMYVRVSRGGTGGGCTHSHAG